MTCTKGAFAAALLATTALVSHPTSAQTVTWDGSTSTDWNDGTNWDGGAAPTAADDAVIDDTTSNNAVIGAVVNAKADGLIVGDAGSLNSLLILNGGTLTTTNDAEVGVAGGSAGLIVVSGAGSGWYADSDVRLGVEGSGRLLVLDGGTAITTATATLGREAGSSGIASVDGLGSYWTVNQSLHVGRFGEGLLTITDQGHVGATQSIIGFDSEATGKVTISDAGSSWANTLGIYVGYFGHGTLEIVNGGDVTSADGEVGVESGSSGVASISGVGSSWTVTGRLDVGANGTGILTIEDGGQVSGLDIYIGTYSNGTGDVTVTGAGSALTSGGTNLYIGYEGDGTLTIADGGAVTATHVHLGYEGGSQGSLTVTGAGSTLTATGNLTLLDGSGDVQATMTISDGGAVANTNGFVGTNGGVDAQVTVTGAGSTWTNTGSLAVGQGGSGTLSILDGGQVSSNQGYIGLLASDGEEGLVTVSGPGSTWANNGPLSVGALGDGTLVIDDGGMVTNTDAIVGDASSGVGTIAVSGAGSTWTSTGNLSLGGSGQGTLTAADQTWVNVVGNARLGQNPGGNGSASITGGFFFVGGSLVVGDSGDSGRLDVAGGGQVTVLGDSFVGFDAGTAGAATVAGAGSIWASNGNLIVGSAGDGTLEILQGGAVTGGNGVLGYHADSSGNATISGAGSSLAAAGFFAVGHSGAGNLTVEEGGQLSSVDAIVVGQSATGTGDVAVIGAGSLMTTASDLIVGGEGTGTITVDDEGAIQSNDGLVGLLAGSHGDATVTGAGSAWTATADFLVGIDGTGTLTVADQGLLDVAGNSFIGYDGAAEGSATVTGAGSTWATAGDIEIGRFGTGALSIEDGGRATATNASIGAIADVGEVAVSGANSLWEMSGTLTVGDLGTGTLNIADGAQVSNTGMGFIGAAPAGNGEVSVVDASWIIGSTLAVGGSGTGALTLDNATVVSGNARVGAAAGSHGMVAVANGSTWTNDGVLTVGGGGNGEVTIADGSTVDAVVAFIADEAGSQGTVNVGAAAGEAPAAPGTLNTTDVEFGAGTGTLVFNHTSRDYLFAAEIDGPGAIEVLAGRTRLPTDGEFTGTATVYDQATLSVGGVLGGTFNVLAGGRLEGTGTVGTANVAGTIAPGNSIGTLTVAGNYTQAPGSTYEVEIDAAGNSDLIDVAGTATLNGGTVEIIPLPDFALVTPYTILTAAGGLAGTFDGVSMAFASLFLTPQLTYDANSAFFTIAQTASFDSVALTPNQKAAAGGADSLGAGNDLWTAVALLSSVDDALTAFDAISGEVHTSAGSMFMEDSRFLREAVGARLGGTAAGMMGTDAGPADTAGFTAWGQGFGSWADRDGDGNAAMLTRDTSGFFLGGDVAIADTWRLGLVTGYSHASLDVDDRASSGTADSYHLGAYAGAGIGNFGLRIGGAYSWHGVETIRVAVFPGFADTLTADYDAATAQIFGEAAYRIDAGSAGVEPFANLAYVDLHTDGFTENGGTAAVTASSSSQDTLFTTLGLRAEGVVPLDGFVARPHGTLGWRHAFGDTVPTSDLNFAGGSVFTIAGVPIVKDAAVIEAGLDLILPGGMFSVGYSGQIGEGLDDHGLKARFEVRF